MRTGRSGVPAPSPIAVALLLLMTAAAPAAAAPALGQPGVPAVPVDRLLHGPAPEGPAGPGAGSPPCGADAHRVGAAAARAPGASSVPPPGASTVVHAGLGPGPLPDADDLRCTGVRPGARMANGCTLGFLFRAPDATYASTAGHCVVLGEVVSVDGVGPVGVAVHRTVEGVGNDFGLVQLREDVLDEASPEMCPVAGPTGGFAGSSILGERVLMAGHGTGVDVPGPAPGLLPPRPRAGVGVGWGPSAFAWTGPSLDGDSGSPVRLASGEALGVHTHVLSGPVRLAVGTQWDQGVALAAEDGIEGLELWTVDHTHPPGPGS